MIRLFFVFVFSLQFTILLAHSPRPTNHLIIDTDGAVDDFRAINYLLAANDVRILAIIASTGSLDAQDIALKLSSLLKKSHTEGIPVGINNDLVIDLPPWSNFCKAFSWSNLKPDSVFENYIDLLEKTIKNYQYPITYIALGSLNSVANFLRAKPQYLKKFDKIIWYNNSQITKGFNYSIDTNSFIFLTKAEIEIVVVSNNRDDLFFTEADWQFFKEIPTIFSKNIYEAFTNILKSEHQKFIMWDDLVALYVASPMLFDVSNNGKLKIATLLPNIPKKLILSQLKSILMSTYYPANRVFINFPLDTSLYLPKIRKNIYSTIDKYGYWEWKAVVMTNEIHGHTGVYSIVGAKMGIRAMEYFNVGVNTLEVISFAGTKPPLSCFNDGIQSSTGSTIGQGLLVVSDTILLVPSAIFVFNNSKVMISLKKEISDYIESRVKWAAKTYTLSNPQYWQYIEDLAYEVWFNFSRFEMFEIKKL